MMLFVSGKQRLPGEIDGNGSEYVPLRAAVDRLAVQ